MTKARKAALYVRVSTDRQTVANQIEDLAAVAAARGWDVVATYQDNGISGAKGRKDRPGLDTLLNDAQRGRFNVVMAWAIDRIGRSLIDQRVDSGNGSRLPMRRSQNLNCCPREPSGVCRRLAQEASR
jgi:predicted site-specific integrase-resolvase